MFHESDLGHSTFLRLKLSEIVIVKSVLHDVDFREAELTLAIVTGSDFAQRSLAGQHLTGVDFRGACNYQIDPLQNKITSAKFTLPEALSLLYALYIEIDDSGE